MRAKFCNTSVAKVGNINTLAEGSERKDLETFVRRLKEQGLAISAQALSGWKKFNFDREVPIQSYYHVNNPKIVEDNIAERGFRTGDWLLLNGLAFNSNRPTSESLVMMVMEMIHPTNAKKLQETPSPAWDARMRHQYDELRQKVENARDGLFFQNRNRLMPGFFVSVLPDATANPGARLAIVDLYSKIVPGHENEPLWKFINGDIASENYRVISDPNIIREMRDPSFQDLLAASESMKIRPANIDSWNNQSWLAHGAKTTIVPSEFIIARLFLNSPNVDIQTGTLQMEKLPDRVLEVLLAVRPEAFAEEESALYAKAYKTSAYMRQELGINIESSRPDEVMQKIRIGMAAFRSFKREREHHSFQSHSTRAF